MRTILFRAKAINSNEWVESMTIAKGAIKRKRQYVFMEVSESKWVGVKPETVSEFTGLTDKNGKRIFEGDILEMKNIGWKYALVKFHSGGFCFYTTETSYLHPIVPCYWKEGEVVGNIHDNPEML